MKKWTHLIIVTTYAQYDFKIIENGKWSESKIYNNVRLLSENILYTIKIYSK